MAVDVGTGVTEEQAIGPYRILGILGEGGQGVVYRARHAETGALVALKMVRVPDASLVAGIRREIFALRSIAHPGVARILDDGVSNGQPWYAMELLGGDTLADVLLGAFRHADLGRTAAAPTLTTETDLETVADTLPPPRFAALDREALADTLGLIRTLCSPLAFVHGEGLVHRDLKPENVVISQHGAPVLVDFGLALRIVGEAGRDVVDVTGRALGTPAYMAPEQIRGETVDARADLYALGCLLFECVTGGLPFDGAPAEVLRMHLERPPPAPSTFVEGLPPALDALVLRLLEKDPRDRLGFATDVAAALADLGGRAKILAGAPSPRPYLYRPRLAGRAAALAALEAALPAPHEPLRVVLVGGPSGVGKTRLAMEAATRASRRGVSVVAGHCLEVGSGPLAPIRPLLLAIADACRASRQLAVRVLADQWPVVAMHEPTLLEVSWGKLAAPAPLPAEAARERLLDALALVLLRYGREAPTLVVLDDLQWADELTMALLDRLGACDSGSELTIVGTYRAEEKTAALAALLEADHVSALELGPLERDAIALMVSDMLAMASPPAVLVDFLARESEGNPFFIAEYLRTAVAEGVLRRASDGRWVAGAAADSIAALRSALPIPEGLRGLVRRRLERLDDDGRGMAEISAVLGQDLDADVLIAAVDLPEQRARRALETLRAGHVLEEGEGGKLRFVHDKLREIIYADVDRAILPSLHGAVARAIEAHVADRRPPHAILAHHHALAGNRQEALDHLERAGEQALASAAWSQARELFAQALSLGEGVEPARRARWERRLGVACYNVGELAEAERRLRRALELLGVRRGRAWKHGLRAGGFSASLRAIADQIARASNVPVAGAVPPGERERFREAALAAERLSQVYYFRSEENLSFATALESLQLAERLGPSSELARAQAILATALTYLPMPRLTEIYARRAATIAAEVGDRHAVAWVAFMRGLGCMRAARHDDAKRFLREALEVALDSGDVRSGQEIQMLLAQTQSLAGERTQALELARHTLAWAARTRNAQAEIWARGAIGKNLIDLGRPAEALAVYRDTEVAAARSEDESTRMALAYRALAHLDLGEHDEAEAIADALDACGQRPATWHGCLGYLAAAETYLTLLAAGRDRRERAERMQRTLARAGRIFRSYRPQASVYEGLLHAHAGRTRRAVRCLRRALGEARDLPAERARAHFELARLLAGRERAHHRSEAAALLDRVGAAGWRARLDALPA